MDSKQEELFTKYVKNGKIVSYPSKKFRTIRPLLYEYLITKFEIDRDYAEKEINEIIKEWILFDDFIIVRREMIEQKLLLRYKDGSKYWVNKEYKK